MIVVAFENTCFPHWWSFGPNRKTYPHQSNPHAHAQFPEAIVFSHQAGPRLFQQPRSSEASYEIVQQASPCKARQEWQSLGNLSLLLLYIYVYMYIGIYIYKIVFVAKCPGNAFVVYILILATCHKFKHMSTSFLNRAGSLCIYIRIYIYTCIYIYMYTSYVYLMGDVLGKKGFHDFSWVEAVAE